MPIHFARSLAGKHRSALIDRRIGILLAFVAGATNAGAFLAVHQYTSHMTGLVSSIADNMVLGAWRVVAAAAGALLAFASGAACSAILVNLGRRRGLNSEYAIPLLVEAVLLLAFGLVGSRLAHLHAYYVSLTVMLLCFSMGLQNALITKLSHAEIRTTHMTGIVTDIGIEVGKLILWSHAAADERAARVRVNRTRLALHSMLLGGFLCGGLVGAWGFNRLGYIATVPLAILLAVVAVLPAWDDVLAWRQRGRLEKRG